MKRDVVVVDADGAPVTPELVIEAYRQRCFPMADHRNGRLRWYRPNRRAVITWDRWRVPGSVVRRARQRPFRLAIDQDFPQVIRACAERRQTWISRDIERLYGELHRQGIAHSVEAWDPVGGLCGGLYGLAIDGCFFGESMFHLSDDAAKLCVLHLAERLQARGFPLLDCQQQSEHMSRFGAYEVDDQEFRVLLDGCPQGLAFP